MRVKKFLQMGIVIAGLAAVPALAQTTQPYGGSPGSPPATSPDTTSDYGRHRENGFDFGWLGLLGLAGLLGLRRAGNRRIDTTDTRGRI